MKKNIVHAKYLILLGLLSYNFVSYIQLILFFRFRLYIDKSELKQS